MQRIRRPQLLFAPILSSTSILRSSTEQSHQTIPMLRTPYICIQIYTRPTAWSSHLSLSLSIYIYIYSICPLQHRVPIWGCSHFIPRRRQYSTSPTLFPATFLFFHIFLCTILLFDLLVTTSVRIFSRLTRSLASLHLLGRCVYVSPVKRATISILIKW